MELVRAVVLGVVQGLTEFLPVSSTAHVSIIPFLFGWSDPGVAFSAVIQLGTLAAVVSYFFKDALLIGYETTISIVERRPFRSVESRLGWMIFIGTIPLIIVALLFEEYIETAFRSQAVIAFSSLVFGVLLWISDQWSQKIQSQKKEEKNEQNMTSRDALFIGLWQAFAVIPGSSRSGTTITGALFLGFRRESAARYSFLLSLPSVFAAGIYQLYKARSELLATEQGVVYLFVATLVAGITGYLSIAFLIEFLKRYSMKWFALYRVLLAGTIFLLIM